MVRNCLVTYLTFSLAILLFGVRAAPCVHVIGSVGTKNFYSATKEITWFETLEFCHNHGMHIASIETEEEYEIVAKYLRTISNKHLWIGATDFFSEGSFHWLSSFKPLNFSNWLNGKPDGGLHRNCVLINGVTSKWEDQLCSFKFSRPLCEIRS